MGLIETSWGVSGIGQNSFMSGWDLSEFPPECVGLEQISLGVGEI